MGAPSVHHLFFADDSRIFASTNLEEGRCVKQCLLEYAHASGQRINLDKSAMSFNANTGEAARTYLKDLFEVPVVHCHERYLGLPTMIGKDKNRVFG